MRSYRLIFVSSILTSVLILCFLTFYQGKENIETESNDFLSSRFEEPEGPIPPLPDSSSFAPELDKAKHQKAEAPSGAMELRWNFADKASFSYDYTLEADIESSISTTGRTMRQDISSNGLMLLESEKDNKAELILRDLKLEIEKKGQAGQTPMTAQQDVPEKRIKGINEDGKPSSDSGEMDISMEIMVRLPSGPLSPGESESITMDAPLKFIGKTMKVAGADTITLDKYVTINGHRCARLVHDIKLTDLEVPDEMKGTYRAHIVGKAVVYFDMEDRCIADGKLALLMSSRVETSPSTPKPPENFRDELPDKVRMVMDADNLISLQRKTGGPQKK